MVSSKLVSSSSPVDQTLFVILFDHVIISTFRNNFPSVYHVQITCHFIRRVNISLSHWLRFFILPKGLPES